jgi:hypothetical protein
MQGDPKILDNKAKSMNLLVSDNDASKDAYKTQYCP